MNLQHNDTVGTNNSTENNQPNNNLPLEHATEAPLSTQGSDEEIEEKLGGTTNLSLEQLKKEKDPGGFSSQGDSPTADDENSETV